MVLDQAQTKSIAWKLSGNGKNCTTAKIGLKVEHDSSCHEREVVFGGYTLQADGTVGANSPTIYMDGTDSACNATLTSGGISTDLATGPLYNENGGLKISFKRLSTLFSCDIELSQFKDFWKPGTYTVTLYLDVEDDWSLNVNKSELGATAIGFEVDDSSAPYLAEPYTISGLVTVQ